MAHVRNPHDPHGKDSDLIRVAIFDDATVAMDQYKDIFEGRGVRLWTCRGSVLRDVEQSLVSFRPQLIIVDLLIGKAREDGYRLVKDLSRVRELTGVPIAICSKLINEADAGKRERESCLLLPGVKEAFGKVPEFPQIGAFLNLIKENN